MTVQEIMRLMAKANQRDREFDRDLGFTSGDDWHLDEKGQIVVTEKS